MKYLVKLLGIIFRILIYTLVMLLISIGMILWTLKLNPILDDDKHLHEYWIEYFEFFKDIYYDQA